MSNRTNVLLGLAAMSLIACGERAKFEPVNYQCTIQDKLIVCPDGSTANLPEDGVDGRDGRDGIDGLPGNDGEDGAKGQDGSIVEVIDPCGDGPGHDEVIFRFANGDMIAWYQGLGFTVLQEGVQYRTTDQQKCKFQVIMEQVVAQ